MLDTTYDRNDRSTENLFKKFIGRSRTGDQLHLSYAGGNNAHCNQRMRLTAVTGKIRLRPGLFCVKCFGETPTNWNDRLVATEIVSA